MKPWWKSQKGRWCQKCKKKLILRASVRSRGKIQRSKWVCLDCGYFEWVEYYNPYRKKQR